MAESRPGQRWRRGYHVISPAAAPPRAWLVRRLMDPTMCATITLPTLMLMVGIQYLQRNLCAPPCCSSPVVATALQSGSQCCCSGRANLLSANFCWDKLGWQLWDCMISPDGGRRPFLLTASLTQTTHKTKQISHQSQAARNKTHITIPRPIIRNHPIT